MQRLPGGSDPVVSFAAGLSGPVRVAYEAGPGLRARRKLAAIAVDCVVCAPGLIPRGPTDRVKTDRRDAERLVPLLAAGELHRVAVPNVEEEAPSGAHLIARDDGELGAQLGRQVTPRHRVAARLRRRGRRSLRPLGPSRLLDVRRPIESA